jgi:hypothetical protein
METPRTLLHTCCLTPCRELSCFLALAQSLVLQPLKLALEPLALIGATAQSGGAAAGSP